jgi:hypothetical protein
MQETKPPTGDSIAALVVPITVERAAGDGVAVAVSHTGNHTIYLVVFHERQSRPQWVLETEIGVAYLSSRP